jgi:hypothetical protein
MDTVIVVAICSLIVGYMIGRSVTNLLNTIAFRELLKDLGVSDGELDKLRKQLNDEPISDDPNDLEQVEVKLEQHHGVIYAYRVKDDQFLGQGADREELIEALKKNLTDVRLIIREDNGAKLIQNA